MAQTHELQGSKDDSQNHESHLCKLTSVSKIIFIGVYYSLLKKISNLIHRIHEKVIKGHLAR